MNQPPAVSKGMAVDAVDVKSALAVVLQNRNRVVEALEQHFHGFAAELLIPSGDSMAQQTAVILKDQLANINIDINIDTNIDTNGRADIDADGAANSDANSCAGRGYFYLHGGGRQLCGFKPEQHQLWHGEDAAGGLKADCTHLLAF